MNTVSMSPMGSNAGSFTPSPANIHDNRFLLYTITLLLCTPSDFADVADSCGDLDMWLKNAGVEPESISSKTRDLCVQYVNKIKQHPTAYLLMRGMQLALRTVQFAFFYVGKPCPTSSDAVALIMSAIQLGNTSKRTSMASNQELRA